MKPLVLMILFSLMLMPTSCVKFSVTHTGEGIDAENSADQNVDAIIEGAEVGVTVTTEF